MNLKKDVLEIKRTLPWLGFDTSGTYGLKVIIFGVVVFIITVNCLVDIAINWSDINARVDGFKGLFDYAFFGLCFMSIIFAWYDTKSLIDIIENKFYKNPLDVTGERFQLEARLQEELVSVHWIWYYGRPVYIGCEILPPIIVLLFRLATTDLGMLSPDMLFTTHRFYYPGKQRSLIAFFIALILQTSFYLYIVKAAYVVIASAFVSMYLLGGEMRLMALSLEQMDTIIKNCKANLNENIMDDNAANRQSMKLYLNNLVQHHQHIYRTANRIGKSIELVAFLFNSGSALLLVTAIYVMVQRDGNLGKLQEAIYFFFMLLASFFYNIMGQEVIIQDENLREVICHSEWVDKPQWFKNSLQIIMIRATRPILMKPMGFFVLDLQNFLKLLKAIYTFYNVLNNVKEK